MGSDEKDSRICLSLIADNRSRQRAERFEITHEPRGRLRLGTANQDPCRQRPTRRALPSKKVGWPIYPPKADQSKRPSAAFSEGTRSSVGQIQPARVKTVPAPICRTLGRGT
jgi:hypothetical protein